MIAALAAGVLSPFFFQAVPEVRSTYISIGKIADDRPMQTTFARVGVDAGDFGRFGIRNWDVSSLTSRLRDVRRLPLWMTEFGPTWDAQRLDVWRYRAAHDVLMRCMRTSRSVKRSQEQIALFAAANTTTCTHAWIVG